MDGFINIHKPADYTSQDVLSVLKRSFRGHKLGHGGTLDPAATGVLVVCLGSATKLQDRIMHGEKVYETDVVFGLDSPTLDMDGEYTVVDADYVLDRTALEQVIDRFVGEQEQVPPMVSAIKKDGVPLYKLARRGIEVERTARRVTIHSLEILSVRENRARLRVRCSAGTYIRALARDLGQALHTCAIVDALTRTQCGEFLLAAAITIEDVAQRVGEGDFGFLLPLVTPVRDLPALELHDLADIRAVCNGNQLDFDGAAGQYRLHDAAGRLLALAHADGEGQIKPDKVLLRKPSPKTPTVAVSSGAQMELSPRGSAVALGNFDGVHGGHRLLIEQMMQAGELRGLTTVALTFSPHPRRLFSDEYTVLQSDEEKARRIGEIGPQYACFLPFCRSVADLPPAAFVEEILVRQLHCRLICVGYNFRFGKDAVGTADWLRAYGADHGIEVLVLPEVDCDGLPVSTSAVKAALEAGDIPRANRLLGYAYSLSGPVVEGAKIGRTIGFPTANLQLPAELFLPSDGVYVARAAYEGDVYDAVVCVGTRPTIAEGLVRKVEVHLLDGDHALYGKQVEARFLLKLRDNKKLDGLDALKAQIARDVTQARTFLATGKL